MNTPYDKWKKFIQILIIGNCFAFSLPSTMAESIVTGGKTGTYYKIGNNLRDVVAPSLEVRASDGSWANVIEMSETKGVTLAIVQSDVYAAFVRERDDSTNSDANRRKFGALLANLRVFMPLYKEEIHFLVRKDDPMEFIHQIRGKQIWMDVERSGTYLTALNIYSKMFQERPNVVEAFINPSALGEDDGTKRRRSALMSLSDPAFYGKSYPKIDVMVLVGGQPLGLLEKNIPSNLKLLKFDMSQTLAENILREYQSADIMKSSYPLLTFTGNASPSLAVNSYLITANFSDPQRNQFVEDFAARFCTQFNVLKEQGHSKWKSLTWQPGSPLPPISTGWIYSEKVKKRLSSCQKICTPQERFAKLC